MTKLGTGSCVEVGCKLTCVGSTKSMSKHTSNTHKMYNDKVGEHYFHEELNILNFNILVVIS